MSDWLEEVEHLHKMCEETKDCKECKLGYCLKLKNKLESRGGTTASKANMKPFTDEDIEKLVSYLPKPKTLIYSDEIKSKLESGLGFKLDSDDVTVGVNRYIKSNCVGNINNGIIVVGGII